MSNEIQELQRIAHKWTVIFLEENLPNLSKVRGGNWWGKCVLYYFNDWQEKMVVAQNISKLGNLDLATNLLIFDKNWYHLEKHLELSRVKRNLLFELRDIRNELAHEDTHGVPLIDQIRHADTFSRYLDFIGADANAVESAKEIHRKLMSRVVEGRDTGEEQEYIEDDQSDHTSTTDEISEIDEIANEKLTKELNDQLTLENLQPNILRKSDGVPLGYLGLGDPDVQNVRNKLEKATYIGIDFGTSNTVVSIMSANESGELQAEPIPISQFDESGLQTDDHILPSCIAWIKEKLLVGHGAKDLEPELIEGQNIWSSFKMKLGTDLGQQYFNTVLTGGKETIERPQDAAKVFFAYLRGKVEDHVKNKGLPTTIYSSVSVPASFEANHRKDLINALSNAGIIVEESSLIDEPNAAFLGYLSDMGRDSLKKRFLDSLAKKERRVMVFDFGAGTCDISVLEVKVENERLLSRNLAISKFMALGGDDIDREIARKILLPQLYKKNNTDEISKTIELENAVLPRLKPAAEALKILCSHMIESQGISIDSLRKNTTSIQGKKIEAITIQNQRWELTSPEITLSEFAEVMDPFLNAEDQPHEQTQNQVRNVFEPIHNALDKSGLSEDDLDMVLFIGGSSSNPLVRKAIETKFGHVDCVTPRDLHTHVSRGSGFYSLFLHGFDLEMIRPITSESIYIITRGGLEKVIDEGTEVPSPDTNITDFIIDRDGQPRIELPLCVGGENKILGIVPVICPDPQGSFKAGTPVRVSCSISHEKLLNVIVITGGEKQTVKIFNPLSNTELITQNRGLLKARQALNESILKGNGRPSVDDVLNYARAAEKAKCWKEAVEKVIIAKQLDPSKNFATDIAYLYSKDGDYQKVDDWSEEAYKTSHGSISAYNLALSRKRNGNNNSYEKLMEESIELDDSNYSALQAYGHYLMDKNDTRGREYVVSAYEILYPLLDAGELNEDDCYRLERVAKTLGKQDILENLRVYREKLGVAESIVKDEFLVSGKKQT